MNYNQCWLSYLRFLLSAFGFQLLLRIPDYRLGFSMIKSRGSRPTANLVQYLIILEALPLLTLIDLAQRLYSGIRRRSSKQILKAVCRLQTAEILQPALVLGVARCNSSRPTAGLGQNHRAHEALSPLNANQSDAEAVIRYLERKQLQKSEAECRQLIAACKRGFSLSQ